MMWPPIARNCPCCGKPCPLVDRVRDVLEREPDAPLGRVLQLVDSNDISMVATLRRMVQLAAGRARVQASKQLKTSSGTRPHAAPALTARLPASRPGAGV